MGKPYEVDTQLIFWQVEAKLTLPIYGCGDGMQLERELGVVVSKLGSQSKGGEFESRLFQILHGNGVKAIPILVHSET